MDISVIIPTYKPKEYIDQCLQSLEAQTLDKESFETIIVLNGEKDPYYINIQNTLTTCTFRYRLIYTPESGVSNARNVGLDNANGRYICFIDDDDFISESYLEAFLCKALNNRDCIIAGTVLSLTDGGSELTDNYISLAYNKFSNIKSKSIFRKRSFLSSACAKLIPSYIIGDRRFDTAFIHGEDTIFMTSITDKIKDIVLAEFCAIYYYRMRSSSASHTRKTLKFIVSDKFMHIRKYISIYMSNPRGYNLGFFIFRIAGVILSRYNKKTIRQKTI